MEKYIDLHIHSSYSDGRYNPKKIIELAKENNVGIISITDHDTMDAYSDLVLTTENEIKIIKGIEISSLYNSKKYKNKKIHILGYGVDQKNKEIIKLLNTLEFIRSEINYEYLVQLTKKFSFLPTDLTKTIDYTKYYRIAWAIVQELKKRKLEPEKIKIVSKYVWNNLPIYDGYDRKDVDVINAIKSSGGIPILAHPYGYKLSDLEVKRMIKNLANKGIEGIEVYHSECTKESMQKLKLLAQSYDLLYSCGSDFHFPTKINNKIIGHGIDNNLCINESTLVRKLIKEES